MVKMYKLCALLAVSLLAVSCTPSIEDLISEGKYKEAEAHKFLNHYVFWFDTYIDNISYYSTEKPGFHCDVVKSKLQRIINTY